MICKLCQSKTNEFITLSNGHQYFLCDVCDLVFLNPQFYLNDEQEKSRYDLHENSIENQSYVAMFEGFIAEAVTPFKTSVKKILDYGSGPGPVLVELLKQKGYEVKNYDPIYARNEFEGEKFDLITSTEVFEHFYNPQKEIEKIISLMKSGAYLSIMTRFLVDKDKFQSWFYKDDPTHVCFYSLKTFDFLAWEHGLKIVKNNGFNLIILQKN